MATDYFYTRTDFYHDPRVILIKKMPGSYVPIGIFLELIYMHMDSIKRNEEGVLVVVCDGVEYDAEHIAAKLDLSASDVKQTFELLDKFDATGVIAEYVRWPKG